MRPKNSRVLYQGQSQQKHIHCLSNPLFPQSKACTDITLTTQKYLQEQEVGGTKAYELQIVVDEKSVVNDYCCHTAAKFVFGIK